MRKTEQILILICLMLIITNAQIQSGNYYPLEVGNRWTYNYVTSSFDGLSDITSNDSGTAVYSVVSKSSLIDSIIWTIKEARSIKHHIHHSFPPIYDTSYFIIDSSFINLGEQLLGNHRLVRNESIGNIWFSVIPFAQEFNDSITFFRYYPLINQDTFTLVTKYPKNQQGNLNVLTILYQRSVGIAKIIYKLNATGFSNQSNHTLKDAVITSTNVKQTNIYPEEYIVKQNYPNPFNPVTIIPFSISRTANISIRIYDMLGRSVCKIVEEQFQAGNYSAIWNASEQSTGTYLCIFQANGISKSIKLVLVK